ncbi:hypothetical protein MWU52_05210 [Jannaschia sp. S6380]|uniref:hypothetical protein n=1 Tax=Jannaschia sp. S6380 TaxID=2926408 RepID=UPI001FF14867|nr:hypothetical protein [Jannaschia sp. S6380]MCK0166946.1 hypothetical protein [Jannaschia sp. S6380]
MHRLAPIALLLTFLSSAPAFAQDDDALDCRATDGGIECAVPPSEGRVLYCLAEDAAGDPIANSTVSAGTGVAVFNTVEPADIDRIAAINCRSE